MGGQNSQWLRLFGNRRSKTLRNRAMSWKGFRAWQQVAKGEVWPSDVGCFLKYLEERHEVQPLGKTTPGALLSSLALLESVGQVPSSDRLSHDSMLLESVRSWQAELEAGAMPPKQAPTSTVSIMLACELVARKSSLPVGYRIMAFILLIMIWGTLRAHDVQNIDPASLRLSGVGLRFTLGRTKTSGTQGLERGHCPVRADQTYPTNHPFAPPSTDCGRREKGEGKNKDFPKESSI